MKFITIFGAGLLTFSGSFALSNNIFAAESTQTAIASETAQTDSTKPPRAELRSAITHVENLENYHAYSLLSADELAATTEFFREYTYLFKVADLAKSFDADYEHVSAEDLADVIKLTEDAALACRLIFGAAHQTSSTQDSVAQGSTSIQAPAASAPKPAAPIVVATSKPQASTPAPTTIATQTAPTIAQPDTAESTTAESSKPTTPEAETKTNDIAVPATGQAEKSHKPLFITLGIVALACLLIGSMIILNRKKPYRPGRKF